MGCKSNVVSRLIHSRFRSTGRQRARASWRRKARKKYGLGYCNWSKAKNKGYTVSVRGADFLLYKTYAYGTPCK
jgi:hypothetical protein